jgi:hypothetical protein
MLQEKIVEDKLYKEEDTAAVLSNSVATLRNDRHLGRGLNYVKLGRSIRYRGADILAYIESHIIEVEAK